MGEIKFNDDNGSDDEHTHPVTFDEERHYVRLSLSIPELKKKLFKKYDNVQVHFDQG